MKTIPFDWFIDTVPQVIERVQQAEKRGEERGEIRGEARGEERGEARGEARGKVKQARQGVVDVVQIRFPVLMNFAQTQVASMTQIEPLRKLMLDLLQAPDEIAAVHLLTAKRE